MLTYMHTPRVRTYIHLPPPPSENFDRRGRLGEVRTYVRMYLLTYLYLMQYVPDYVLVPSKVLPLTYGHTYMQAD